MPRGLLTYIGQFIISLPGDSAVLHMHTSLSYLNKVHHSADGLEMER